MASDPRKKKGGCVEAIRDRRLSLSLLSLSLLYQGGARRQKARVRRVR